MKPNLAAKLAATETELACVRMVLAHVDRDELRQERDDLRREAEMLCAEKLIAAKLREADERHVAPPGAPPMVASPRGRLETPAAPRDPNVWPSAPDLEPSEGKQDERYDERTDRMLASDVSGARLEPREKRGKATHWKDAKKPGDSAAGVGS
jgi:hypothetical protein